MGLVNPAALLAVGLLAAAGCSAKDEPQQVLNGADVAPRETAAAAPAPAASGTAAGRAVDAIVVAAKKRLAADRAVVSNRLGWEKAVARHEKQAEVTEMDERLPAELPSAAALQAALAPHAAEAELKVVEVALGEAPGPDAPVPAVHAGGGPYRYSLDQLVARVPVAIRLSPPERARLEVFWRALPGLHGVPLLDLVAVKVDGEVATLSGVLYVRRAITPPVHAPVPVTLASLAEEAGVAVPEGHPRLAEVEALLAEHAALDLRGSLAALAKAHLLGAQFKLFDERTREIAARPFPKPVTDAPRSP